jgi:hypothetical protein
VTCQRSHWKQGHKGICKSVANELAVFEQSVDASKDPYLSTIEARSMRKAIVLMKRADLFLHGSAERKDGYRMALGEIEKVLENDPEDRAATWNESCNADRFG